MTLIFLDTETTGLDPKTHSIFQISGVIKSDTARREFDFRLHPYRNETITEEAQKKTVILQEELETYRDQKEVFKEDFEDAHNSLADVLATERLFYWSAIKIISTSHKENV